MLKRTVKSLIDKSGIIRGSLHRNDRSGALHRAWGHVFTNHMVGDYVEFGVDLGASFVESYQQYQLFRNWLAGQLQSEELWRREVASKYIDHNAFFRGLDTFEGMPENNEGNATFAGNTFVSSLDNVKSRCDSAGMPSGQYRLYQGLFSATKEALISDLKKIAILNIDSDLYESALDALTISGPYLQVGSVVMFDDYNAFHADNRKGERRAFREFCLTSRYKFEPWFSYMYSGQAFLCVED
jgi:O-methyltransferase